MHTNKKLLIVTRDQFGYHVDPYEYAKELTKYFTVTYYCWDYERPKVEVEGVEVIYSSREGNMVKRNLRFIKEFLALLPHYECSLLFYFVGVSLGHLRAKQNQMVCDLRTGNVRSSRFRRWFFDAITYLELLTFRNKSFISRGLAQHFGMGNHHILPLGSSITPATERSYEHLHLFYVGTFSDRNGFVHTAVTKSTNVKQM
ncbi:MAG: hypothetical protein AAFQ37_06940, partial [Bacteroidota bacterium]